MVLLTSFVGERRPRSDASASSQLGVCSALDDQCQSSPVSLEKSEPRNENRNIVETKHPKTSSLITVIMHLLQKSIPIMLVFGRTFHTSFIISYFIICVYSTLPPHRPCNEQYTYTKNQQQPNQKETTTPPPHKPLCCCFLSRAKTYTFL